MSSCHHLTVYSVFIDFVNDCFHLFCPLVLVECRPPASLALTSTISMIVDVEHLVLTLKVYDFFNHLACALVLQTIFSVHRCCILYIVHCDTYSLLCTFAAPPFFVQRLSSLFCNQPRLFTLSLLLLLVKKPTILEYSSALLVL